MKNKKTIEEAGIIAAGICEHLDAKEQALFIAGFIESAKWQAKRMYSEKDLISFAHFYFEEEFNSTMQTSKSTDEIFKEWFGQNKNE